MNPEHLSDGAENASAKDEFVPSAFVPGRVSVIVPVFNRSGILKETLLSALNQTYREIEVIIVDDGSTDDTPEVLAELTEEHGAERLRVVRQANAGAPAARNHGVRLSRGEFIQFLDSDDWLHPEKLAGQVAYLRDHPGVDMTYCRTAIFQADPRESQPGYWRHLETPDLETIAIHPGWPTNAALWRRKAVRRTGPWDEDLGCNQEYEYHARALSRGIRARGTSQIWNFVRREIGGGIHAWGAEEADTGTQRMGAASPTIRRAEGFVGAAVKVRGHLLRCGIDSAETREHLAHLAGMGGQLFLHLGERARAREAFRWALSLRPSLSRRGYLLFFLIGSRLGMGPRAIRIASQAGRTAGRFGRRMGLIRRTPESHSR
jgi:hypothetical protein